MRALLRMSTLFAGLQDRIMGLGVRGGDMLKFLQGVVRIPMPGYARIQNFEVEVCQAWGA